MNMSDFFPAAIAEYDSIYHEDIENGAEDAIWDDLELQPLEMDDWEPEDLEMDDLEMYDLPFDEPIRRSTKARTSDWR